MKADEPITPKRQTPRRSPAFYILLAAALYVLIQAYALLSPILLSFILIVLITLAVNPVVCGMRAWTGGRKQAMGLIMAGLLIFGGLTVWVAIVPLKKSVITLSERLPVYWERLQKPLIKMEQKAILSEEKLQVEVSAEIARETLVPGEDAGAQSSSVAVRTEAPRSAEATPKPEKEEGSLRSSLVGALQGIFGQLKGWAFNTTQMLIVLVTVFFGVTFSLMNPRPIFEALFSVVPERHHEEALAIMQRIAKFVPRWAVSVLISMLTIGSLFFLLMWPIFGLADALLLGLIACILSAIPFLGPILSLIPALLLAIGEGGMTPVWVLLAYLAVQALEGNVILPLIMSRGMKLHPVAVIFAMLISVAAFGVLGVLIAAPLVAIAGIVHEEVYRKHFLPTVTDEDLEHLARGALLDKRATKR